MKKHWGLGWVFGGLALAAACNCRTHSGHEPHGGGGEAGNDAGGSAGADPTAGAGLGGAGGDAGDGGMGGAGAPPVTGPSYTCGCPEGQKLEPGTDIEFAQCVPISGPATCNRLCPPFGGIDRECKGQPFDNCCGGLDSGFVSAPHNVLAEYCEDQRPHVVCDASCPDSVRFVSNLGAPEDLVVANGELFWTDGVTGEVGAVELATSDERVVADGLAKPRRLLVKNGYVYISDETGNEIWRKSALGTGDLEQVAAATGPVAIAADDQHVYWTEESTFSIKRAPLAGGSAEVFSHGEEKSQPDPNGGSVALTQRSWYDDSLAVDGGFVHALWHDGSWNRNGQFVASTVYRRINTTDAQELSETPLAANVDRSLLSLFAGRPLVVFGNLNDNSGASSLYLTDVSSPTSPQLVSATRPISSAVNRGRPAQDTDYVYWTDGPNLMRVGKCGGASAVLLTVKAGIRGLALGGDGFLYFAADTFIGRVTAHP